MAMIHLPSGSHNGLQICPRWPSWSVVIAPEALDQLQHVQAALPAGIGLILTRGYEPRSSRLGALRSLSRLAGIALFKFLYAARSDEIADIFGANGHDQDGTHLDISLAIDGKRIRLLPLSVFTPVSWQQRRVAHYAGQIALINSALIAHGFRIHRNATESHQIHCDLVRSKTALP